MHALRHVHSNRLCYECTGVLFTLFLSVLFAYLCCWYLSVDITFISVYPFPILSSKQIFPIVNGKRLQTFWDGGGSSLQLFLFPLAVSHQSTSFCREWCTARRQKIAIDFVRHTWFVEYIPQDALQDQDFPQEYSLHVSVNRMVSPIDTQLALDSNLCNHGAKDLLKEDVKSIQILPYQP